MLGSNSTNLEVRVDGKVDRYEAAMRRAERATLRTERTLKSLDDQMLKLEREMNDEATRRIDARNAAFDRMGRGAVIAGTALLTGAALSARAAVKWESDWAGVEKTVDGSQKQMEGLEAGLRNLARTLPASHHEIAAVAEAAGQLGVQRDDIVDFTKVMIDMGETTNLSADEASTALARFMNIMGTAADDVDRLGATIVDLGNKGASTEAEIVAMGLRIAGAGNQIGLSEAQVLAFANALSSLGVEAEAGGSSISTIFLKAQADVDSASGPMLAKMSEVAGMSRKTFSDLWNRDSAAAFVKVVSGLQNIDASGGSVITTLNGMGITEIRQRDAMLRLVGGGDLLRKSLRDGNTAWQQNSALIAEATKRYDTTESKLQVARNQINDTAITIGETFLPVLGDLAGQLGTVNNFFTGLPGPVKSLIGPVAALAGVIALVGGAMLIAVPKIAAFNAALSSGNLPTNIQRTGKAAQGLASFLTGPWGVALAIGTVAIGGLAAGAQEARDSVRRLQETLSDDSGEATQETLDQILATLQDKGWDDFARDIGLNMEDVARAVLYGGDAMDQLIDKVREHEGELGPWARLQETATGDHEQFIRTIQSENKALGGAKVNLKESKDAQQDLGLAAKGATPQVAGMTEELEDQKTAAEQLQEAIEGLNSAILGGRAGARDYQQTLDEADKTLRRGKRTLDIHTKAGRDNQAALDSIADSTIAWSDKLKEVDASGRRSFKVMQQGRKDLFEAARTFGMTRQEARKYVDEVLRIPSEWKTKFDTPNLPKSKGDVRNWRELLDKVPKHTDTKANFDGRKAARDAAQAAADIARALSGIPDEPVNIKLTAQARKVQRQLGDMNFWEGGPVYGAGTGTSDSIAARLSNGEHVVTAEEVRKAGGHRVVEAFRRAAKRGELPRIGELPAFADGGAVNINPSARELGVLAATGALEQIIQSVAAGISAQLSAKASKAFTEAPIGGMLGFAGNLTPAQLVRGQQFARAQVGKPYIWGGVGPRGYDCSGAVSAVTRAALGQQPYVRMGSTGTMPWPGWGMGYGKLSAGWFTGSPGHTAGNIGGLPFESAGGVGFRVGGSATSVGSFPRHMHLGIHDEGGWLRPGDLALNKSGKPEPVFSSAQWDKLGKLIEKMEETHGKNSPLVVAAKELRKDLSQRATEGRRLLTELANVRSSSRELGRTAAQPFLGNSNLFEGGAAGARTLLQAQANDARRQRNALREARAKGLSRGLYNQLVAAGNYGVSQEFAHMSGREIRQFNQLYAARGVQAARLSRSVGRIDQSHVRELRQEINRLERGINRMADKLESAVERGSERGTRRGAGDAGRRTNVRKRS